MQITEQNKQEAEKVVGLYSITVPRLDIGNNISETLNPIIAINSAIQDRQSVLEALDKIRNSLNYSEVTNEINNLTEQINYLKSKL